MLRQSTFTNDQVKQWPRPRRSGRNASPGSPGGPVGPASRLAGSGYVVTSAGSRRIGARSSNLRAQDGGKRQDGDKACNTEQQLLPQSDGEGGGKGNCEKAWENAEENYGGGSARGGALSSKCRQRLHVNCCSDDSNNCKQWESVSK